MAGPSSQRRIVVTGVIAGVVLVGILVGMGLAAFGPRATADAPLPPSATADPTSPSPASSEPSASPPSSAPAPTQEPTAVPTESQAPEPPPPNPGRMTHADFGSFATVLAEGLRLRTSSDLDGYVAASLPAGQELRILSGPIRADGYVWYQVEIESPAYDQGWVAAVPSEGGATPPDDAWLIDIGPLLCPNPADIDTELLARTTGYAVERCDIIVGRVSGLVDNCYEDGFTPFSYEPEWAGFACLYLRDEAQSWSLPVHFPADLADPLPERGDVVTLRGGLGVDKDQYGECRVSTSEEIGAERLSAERQRFRAACRTIFVVSSVRVDDHIDLPDRY